MSDALRKLIELAINAGRRRQSPQTGFVHHFYHPTDDEPALTIPLIENFLFILSLLRSKGIENANEAKTLLERLLPFQNGLTGNFPVYLHEYPECRDRYLGAHLLIPLYWIQTSTILGNSLKSQLDQAFERLLNYCLSLPTPPPAVAFKIAAVAAALGKGEPPRQLDPLLTSSPSLMAEILPAMPLLPSPQLWEPLLATWDPSLLTFKGPALSLWQEGSEPQATLYDLYLGFLTGTTSARALKEQVIHLQATLIYPQALTFLPSAKPYALATYPHSEPWPSQTERAFHRLNLSWGTPQQLHTLVCQNGNIAACSFDTPHRMTTRLGPLPPEGEREKSRELAFYLNLEAASKISVGPSLATTFQLNEPIIIVSEPLTITLTFHLLEGQGDFVGHIMRGNRPSQLAVKGKNRFHAYDWQIFLRTLRRSDPCTLQTVIEIKE